MADEALQVPNNLTTDEWEQLVPALTHDLIDGLLTKQGRIYLADWINQTADTDANITIETWLSTQAQASLQDGALASILKPFLSRLKTTLDKARSRSGSASPTPPASIVSFLKSAQYIPPQLVEILDDVQNPILKPSSDGGVADGAMAGALSLFVCAAIQGHRYYTGKIDLHDAVGHVVKDTTVAVLVGNITSKIVSTLGLSLSTGGLAVLLTPLVHAAINTTLGWIFSRLLGGQSIHEAHRLHINYLEVAEAIQRQLVPRLRKLEKLGTLVDTLHRLETQEDTRQSLYADAMKQLRTMCSREAGRPLLGPDITPAVFQKYLAQFLVKLLERENGSFLREVKNEYGENPEENTAFVNRYLNVAKVSRLQEIVSREYWRGYSPGGAFSRRDAYTLAVDCSRHFANDHDPFRHEIFRIIMELLANLENTRTEPDSPLRVWHYPGDGYFCLRASDFLEYVHFMIAVEIMDWSWTATPAERQYRLPDAIWHTKNRGENRVQDFSILSEYPKRKDLFNPLYQAGMFQGLLTGQRRLFKFYMEPGMGAPHHYICVPSRGSIETQVEDLSQSLERYHPEFQGQRRRTQSLSCVEIEAFLKDQGSRAFFAMMGVYTMPMNLYTATFRVAKPDDPGNEQYVFIDGYFQNIDIAREAFENSKQTARLIGVRPGGVLLNTSLRKLLSQKDRTNFWLLQHQLIGCVAEGLILLDEMANQDEQHIARLAKMGVFMSWWWALTGRTRKELVANLKEKQVQQTLRIELMQALIALQRIHVLNHEFFNDTLFKPLASLAEEEEKAAIAKLT